jgi:hypothetical protein
LTHLLLCSAMPSCASRAALLRHFISTCAAQLYLLAHMPPRPHTHSPATKTVLAPACACSQGEDTCLPAYPPAWLHARLRCNTKVSTLRLAYCSITSTAAHHIADGLIAGSKIKVKGLGFRVGFRGSYRRRPDGRLQDKGGACAFGGYEDRRECCNSACVWARGCDCRWVLWVLLLACGACACGSCWVASGAWLVHKC